MVCSVFNALSEVSILLMLFFELEAFAFAGTAVVILLSRRMSLAASSASRSARFFLCSCIVMTF
jgi:hypothetical protein